MLYSVQRGEEKNLRLRCEFHRTLTLTQWVAEIRSIDMFLNVAYHLVYDKHGKHITEICNMRNFKRNQWVAYIHVDITVDR